MAALIEEATGQSVELERGNRGEFTVWVDDRVVAQKTVDGFPTDEACVEAVKQALGG